MRLPFLRGHAAGLAAWAALLAAPAGAHVGRWQSWSNVNPVNAMLEHKGRLWVGTGGGVRSIDPASLAEKVYDNLSGLTDVRVMGLAEDPDGRLWAASRSGQLFRLDGQTWTGFGRSYRAEGWTVNQRAFLAVAGYLLFGSEKGLTFFDRRQGISVANLTRFGTAGQTGVTGLLRSGDTLYIATGRAVFKAAVDWSDLLSTRFGTIFDPQIWKPAEGLVPVDSLPQLAKRPAFRKAALDTIDPPIDTIDPPIDPPIDTIDPPIDPPIDTIDPPIDPPVLLDTSHRAPVQLARLDGKLVAHDTGTYLAGTYRVKALRNRPLAVNGKTYADSSIDVALAAGGKLFLGSRGALMVFRPEGPFDTVETLRSIPNGTVGAISASGLVAAQTADRLYTFDSGRNEWRKRFEFGFKSDELLRNELRNLRVTPGDNIWLGGWGLGVIKLGRTDARRWGALTDGACLEHFFDSAYTVVQALDVRGKDMWIATLIDGKGAEVTTHNLSHLDLETGNVTCPDYNGPGQRATAVRILDSTLLAVAGEEGIHLVRWGKRDGAVFASPIGALKTEFGQVLGRDAAFDSQGRIWALFSEQLGYVDSVRVRIDSGNLRVKFPNNLKLKTCRDMERDARGHLWVGCDNGIFHVRPGADPEAPEVDHHNADNGLLSNRVFDLSVDLSTGHVWAASEGGLSRYEGPSPPVRRSLKDVRAYPNPFLARHALLVLDNLTPDADAAILSQSGEVVRRFRPSELRGNQYHWDGNNASGSKVKPGVYFYSVTSGSRTSRGKIIVAR